MIHGSILYDKFLCCTVNSFKKMHDLILFNSLPDNSFEYVQGFEFCILFYEFDEFDVKVWDNRLTNLISNIRFIVQLAMEGITYKFIYVLKYFNFMNVNILIRFFTCELLKNTTRVHNFLI